MRLRVKPAMTGTGVFYFPWILFLFWIFSKNCPKNRQRYIRFKLLMEQEDCATNNVLSTRDELLTVSNSYWSKGVAQLFSKWTMTDVSLCFKLLMEQEGCATKIQENSQLQAQMFQTPNGARGLRNMITSMFGEAVKSVSNS